MNITWLGTAGFLIKSDEGSIAFDPFLSRGERAKPSPFKPQDFSEVEAIFLGHGHFDHAYDIPAIATHSEAKIFAPGLTGSLLQLRGVSRTRLHLAQNDKYLYEPLKLRAFKSQHVTFDRALVTSTVRRCGLRQCAHIARLGVSYPKGLVQTYLFEVKGKKILFISSAGCTEEELKTYQNLDVDYLLAPLQGHSHIQAIAARMTAIIKPKVVIPHHHDDFYPPMSQEVSVSQFKEELERENFRGQLLEMPLFQDAEL